MATVAGGRSGRGHRRDSWNGVLNPPLNTTTDIAGYRIERMIGRGGMGIVYLAEQLHLRRRVALKVIAPEYTGDPAFRERFRRESELAAAIDHPHVIPIYEAGVSGERLFISMRFVDGPDLADMTAEGPLEPARTVRVTAQIASALDAAHARGLVHRDVKPGNILLAGDQLLDHAYLTDFGLTKRLTSAQELTRPGQWVGTLNFSAPEQIQGQNVDGRADLYSLACVFFDCLAGSPPFAREADVAILWAHVQETPPPLTAVRPDLPPAIDEVLWRALAKSPADRFATCSEFVSAAKSALGLSAPTSAGLGPPPPVAPAPPTLGHGGSRSHTVAEPPRPAGPPLPLPPAAPPKRREIPWVAIALITMALVLAGGAAAVALILRHGSARSTASSATHPTAAAPAPGATVRHRSRQAVPGPAPVAHPPATSQPASPDCPPFLAHNPDGTSFAARNIAVVNGSCAEAQGVITSGPAGRARAGWDCPLTGDKTFTSCTKGTQSVAWSIQSAGGAAPGGGADCASFAARNPDGSTFLASNIQTGNIGCGEARAVIDSGPHGRVKRGWRCPLTGDSSHTDCRKGSQTLSWDIRAG